MVAVNPSSYSFTPPADLTNVTSFKVVLRRYADQSFVAETTLPSTATGGTFEPFLSTLLAPEMAGVEVDLYVHTVSGNVVSEGAVGVPHPFRFLPAVAPTNVVIHS